MTIYAREFAASAPESRLIRRELLRLGSLPINHGYYIDRTLPENIDVMATDWDNLLILDACRYDYFEH